MARRWIISLVVGALLVAPGMAQAAPTNDNFADATLVTTPTMEIVDTSEATMEVGEQDACNNGSTVWYRLNAASDDEVEGDTQGSNFDTVLAVYTGDSLENLELLTCNDDWDGLLSQVNFAVEAGATYFIQAGGFGGGTGELHLNLHQPGAIEGTVTEDAGGEPLEGICVTAYQEIIYEEEDVSYYDEVGWATTEADGGYRLTGVDGSVRILFEDCEDQFYVDEWYDDASSAEDATEVFVPGGTTMTGIDAALTLGGSISGRVSDLNDVGLDGICLEATTPDGDPIESTYTGYNGTYRIGSLPAGSYAVAVNLCGPIFIPRPVPGPGPYEDAAEASLSVVGNDYESEWYDDKPSLEEADLVSVVAGGDTPAIDAAIGLRPRPDLAVTELSVENVPLVTDAGPLPTGTGWNRRISFTVENQGNTIARGARMAVRACTITDGVCELVELVRRPVAAGQVISATVDWNALGAVGDVVILVTATHWDDPNGRNNYRTARHYVLVGGTGFGVTACGFGPTPNACV